MCVELIRQVNLVDEGVSHKVGNVCGSTWGIGSNLAFEQADLLLLCLKVSSHLQSESVIVDPLW